ncbi:hypothetical protein [Streptomyces phaeochromogenes]|uniref:hypothetical protein n=1 Tax=Streptomyces phaeochromogenes TaxID=1923 RepID=UPI002DDB6278|nr:hypothetical protein [Streptomyces phaeochromogenes]WRZ30175.1 hypothetical protein OG931_21715 [Streptomyces phaeochromogenes]
MALPYLATLQQLRDYLPGRVIPDASGELALRLASAAIRNRTKQTITFVAGETVILTGGERVLKLPQRPLVVDDANPLTVVELLDGNGFEVPAIEGNDFVIMGSELHRGENWPTSRLMGWPRGQPVGIWADRVRVLYSHGEQEIPDDLMGICLDLASATLANPNRLRSESAGATAVTYTVETFGTGSLTADHEKLLKKYLRSTMSVAPS